MTERLPKLLQPIVKKFYSYSDYPLSLGVSDFCTFDKNGDRSENIEFPYVIVLKPTYNTQKLEPNKCKRFDSFIEDLMEIPIGSPIFDVYACPDPSSALHSGMIQRIGRIITTSEMVPSLPNDGLFFRHQKKEEDFDLRPSWKDEVKGVCVTKDGLVEGSIGKVVGATFLEKNINEKKFIDYETS